MNRAVVMSLEGKKAVVLAPGGQFIRVPNRERLQVGDEIELEEGAQRLGVRGNTRRRVWTAGSAACAAAILLLAGSLWLRPSPVVAYVSMDVNPSFELGIDSKERVVELQALNRDAEPIVAELKFKGKDVGEVAEVIAEELAERELLVGADSEVVLASVAVKKVDEQWEAEVTDKLRQAIEKAGTTEPADPADPTGEGAAAGEGTAVGNGSQPSTAPEVTTISLPKEVREEAKENGVSAGKMAFWLKAESQGHQVSLEELKNSSMKKIAESWGGVKQVFGDSELSSSEGSSDWKNLLQNAQEIAKDKAKEKEKEEEKEKEKEKEKGSKNSGLPSNTAGGGIGSASTGNNGSPAKRGDSQTKDKPGRGVPNQLQEKDQDKDQDKDKDKDKEKDKMKDKDKDEDAGNRKASGSEAGLGFGSGSGIVGRFGFDNSNDFAGSSASMNGRQNIGFGRGSTRDLESSIRENIGFRR
ncbi:anti-sigma factor domain-containing protein [Cohnella lubricantis]|uniref:Anti-sigma factor domain-containing protein n=1 Tax=Cohnella lubricantis TaxID=2163172 RepID=A0A841TEN7_9BACL|nr:anti-sigma factor domain-containing protein [Cohnella lubricantis]MBB6678449.1 anti-sigma factor domain-containing protein [Cohnella lubricantis]MBP2116829.1 hypothetical protein [Cohnella lubricantis]